MATSNTETPPTYNENLPVLYDETFRGIWGSDFGVASMGNRANLIGYLEHYAPTTDGSFAICIAGGKGVVISKALYESIPEEHRPPLDTSHTQPVAFTFGGSQTAIGSTIIPVILKNADTGKLFKIKIYALVLENLLMGMFIGQGSAGTASQEWSREGVAHFFNFGHEDIRVKGC
ncbi:hypothetical protein BDZ89DRAFT_1060458 [Hymenopellis radicata]|nr:hypothetical protein BDZ89DRAFT_1060458 [Hymenopellis radicata]